MSNKPHRTQGTDLLSQDDRVKQDPDLAELSEPLNLRTSDQFDAVLGDILKANPGGYMTNKQYTMDVPGSSYPEDVAFDRFYWNHRLLVDFIQEPMVAVQREEVAARVAKKQQVADNAKLTYLPIIGSATREEIRVALGV